MNRLDLNEFKKYIGLTDIDVLMEMRQVIDREIDLELKVLRLYEEN